ncbi:MAG: hypothetical protein MJ244_06465 [Clostridia bacterium]|nr:hypothetical protein [Clostridia bacterium]
MNKYLGWAIMLVAIPAIYASVTAFIAGEIGYGILYIVGTYATLRFGYEVSCDTTT